MALPYDAIIRIFPGRGGGRHRKLQSAGYTTSRLRRHVSRGWQSGTAILVARPRRIWSLARHDLGIWAHIHSMSLLHGR